MNIRFVIAILLTIILASCGGGSSSPDPKPSPVWHNVTLSWTANREKGVNSTGGGYIVNISGQTAPITVPYVSGVAAPTSVTTSLYTGNYTATVTAYAALDTAGGNTGNTSIPSAQLTITVP